MSYHRSDPDYMHENGSTRMTPSTLNTRLRHFALPALLTVSLLLAAGCEEIGTTEPVETHDDSFTVSGTVTIDVNSFNGSVTVTGSETNTVRVEATVQRADKVDYRAEQFGSSVQVTASQVGSVVGRSPSVDIEISGPSSAQVILRTSNGALELRNFDAGAVLRTSNGRVTVAGLGGDLDVITNNGTIEVTGHTGAAELETSNGPIRYTGDLVPGSDNGMRTSNGSVTVTLQGRPSVVLDATTSNGSARSSQLIDVTASGSDYLEGIIGSGEAELLIRTSNGSILVQ